MESRSYRRDLKRWMSRDDKETRANLQARRTPVSERDVCAHCGKFYDEHLLWDGNKCSLGSINGWFPKRVADAFTASRKLAPIEEGTK